MSEVVCFEKEKECPICGKTFLPLSQEWAYRWHFNGKLMVFCSWGCMRKFEKERDKKQNRNVTVENIWKMLAAGEYPKFISETLGVPIKTVEYYKEKREGNL